jgi:hypothetical protein
MINVSQRAGVFIRFEEPDFLDSMQKYQTENGMSQFMHRSTEPGYEICPAGAKSIRQRLEGKLRDELNDQPEDKDTSKDGSHLGESRQEEVFDKEENSHAGCMISASSGGVKGKHGLKGVE